MRKLILGGILIALTMMLGFGCGGDDCPTCPSSVDTVTVTVTETDTVTVTPEYLAWVNGFVQLDPNAYFSADIFGNGGGYPYIDSFAIGDSVCTDVDMDYWAHESDPYYWLMWYESGSSPMYESGDIAVVTLWGNDMSSTASVVALDWWEDWPDIMVPDDGDSALLYGSEITCEWESIANAEWYGIELDYDLDSAGTTIYRSFLTFTYDTVYVVTDTAFGYAVEYVDLYALPTTGPDPESGASNWTGELATGKLYSIGDYAYAYIHFFNGPSAAKAVVTYDQPKLKKTGREIIEAVYDAYR